MNFKSIAITIVGIALIAGIFMLACSADVSTPTSPKRSESLAATPTSDTGPCYSCVNFWTYDSLTLRTAGCFQVVTEPWDSIIRETNTGWYEAGKQRHMTGFRIINRYGDHGQYFQWFHAKAYRQLDTGDPQCSAPCPAANKWRLYDYCCY